MEPPSAASTWRFQRLLTLPNHSLATHKMTQHSQTIHHSLAEHSEKRMPSCHHDCFQLWDNCRRSHSRKEYPGCSTSRLTLFLVLIQCCLLPAQAHRGMKLKQLCRKPANGNLEPNLLTFSPSIMHRQSCFKHTGRVLTKPTKGMKRQSHSMQQSKLKGTRCAHYAPLSLQDSSQMPYENSGAVLWNSFADNGVPPFCLQQTQRRQKLVKDGCTPCLSSVTSVFHKFLVFGVWIFFQRPNQERWDSQPILSVDTLD